MARRRKPGRQKQHTISCRDVEWERVRSRAAAEDMSISRYLVARALEVEIITNAGGGRRVQPRLVLSEEEQVQIHDRQAQIAERVVVPDSPLEFERMQNRLKFLAQATADDMIQRGRARTMTAILVEILGEEQGTKVAAAYVDRARKRRQAGSD